MCLITQRISHEMGFYSNSPGLYMFWWKLRRRTSGFLRGNKSSVEIDTSWGHRGPSRGSMGLLSTITTYSKLVMMIRHICKKAALIFSNSFLCKSL
ncbi:hypothetical protein Zmor_028117 [Zophobas morio]|uniref:Uncharacterized protein n=1 Tax=Zophobas morio TaxID=2755281 RepID=A0AA38HR65_9CUCU|nr:hypothetical protein Zmor_028117 [Zophobas morio]